jgi:hypothetical protein
MTVEETARLDAEVIRAHRGQKQQLWFNEVRELLVQHRGLKRLSVGRYRRAVRGAGATFVSSSLCRWESSSGVTIAPRDAKPKPDAKRMPKLRVGPRPEVPATVPTQPTLYTDGERRILVFGAGWDSVAVRELRSDAIERRVPYAEWPSFIAGLKPVREHA